jgi:hypothetical protein
MNREIITACLVFIVTVTIFLQMVVYRSVSNIERLMLEADAEYEAQVEEDRQAYTETRQRIVTYLTKRQGRYPQVVADACMATDEPQLCAAVALVESTANPYCLPGDHGLSHGGWQIQPQWWGRVPTDPYAQARKWSRVMDSLLMRHDGDLIHALAAYNEGQVGRHGLRYAAMVLRHREKML